MATIKQKTDQTIGGNNYYIQPSSQQGQQNSLVNTGAVAGIKQQPMTGKKLSTKSKSITPEREAGAPITDKTIGGNNYYYKDPAQQGLNNALVGTGAVAGIQEQPKVGQKFTGNFKGFQIPEKQVTTPTPEQTPAPTPTPTVQKKNTISSTPQPTPQPVQEQPQEEISIVDDGRKYEEPQEVEQPQEQVQEEEREKPEMNLEDGGEGLIYGRASGNAGQEIRTNEDVYSAENIINQERQTSYNALQGMDSYNIAVSIANGYTPQGEQAMRDLQQYDPQKYNDIQNQLKAIQIGENVNSIAKDGHINITSQIESTTQNINNDIDSRAKKNSTAESYSSTLNTLTDKLASSQTAQTATQEMLNINKDIAEIQSKMENLPNEAKKAFKGDVPDYLVRAYVSNKQQEYQAQLSKLQSRYQSASDLYKTELAQKQWEAEMELKNKQFQSDQMWKQFDYNFKTTQQNRENNFKQSQFNRQVGQQNRKNNLDLAQFNLSAIKTDSSGRPYQLNQDGTYTYLQDTTTQMLINQQRQNAVNTLMSIQDGTSGGQCEAFTNRYLENIYGTRFKGKNGYTTAEEKIGYRNTTEPVIGSIAIFDYGKKDKDTGINYGHTMVVTGYDPTTGDITLKGSNRDGTEKVYTSTVNISQLNTAEGGLGLKGFYDPMLDKTLDNNTIVEQQNQGYGWNQMTNTFENLISNAKSDSARSGVATTERLYGTLQELRDNGSLYELINSGDLAKIVGQMKQMNFGNDDGSQFQNELGKIIGNTSLGLSEKSKIALNEFYTLVEAKLRKESGAAISSSEWMSNFQMMLPQSNESKELQESKLKNWDKLMYSRLRTSGISQKDYIPLFQDELPTGIEQQLEDIINDDRTGITGKKFQPYR